MIYIFTYLLEEEPFISVIIPNKDHVDDLERCINSLYEVSRYSNFEVIIVENGSNEKKRKRLRIA